MPEEKVEKLGHGDEDRFDITVTIEAVKHHHTDYAYTKKLMDNVYGNTNADSRTLQLIESTLVDAMKTLTAQGIALANA